MYTNLRHHFIILITSLILSVTSVFAQFESRGEKYNRVDAEAFYYGGNYYDALPLYELLLADDPDKEEYKFKIGICHLQLNNYPELAVEYLAGVYTNKPETSNVEYYLGKAYALNYNFDLAIETFQKAESNKNTSEELKENIPHLVAQCTNGKELVKNPLAFEIINIGKPINSSDSEYGSSINEDETTIIFTYSGNKSIGGRQDGSYNSKINGNFYEDIYVSQGAPSAWSAPKSIGDSINSNMNDASISLSADGQKLIIYKDSPESSGEIYETNNINGEWTSPVPLSINSDYWEGHAAISPDGKFMIFSSERPGGIGLRDLYSSVLLEDGTWGDIKNLGPNINTKYDDDAPFIHLDGETFNFSSKGHNSMGGYDIFESKIVTDSTYSNPRNVGYPINTTSNDMFFSVTSKGNAYYSSSRKGGFGQQDIYMIKKYIADAEVEEDTTLLSEVSPSLDEVIAEDKGVDPAPIDAGKTIALNNIEYGFDKSNLNSESKAELDKLVVFLKEHKDIKVEISSHTDGKLNVEGQKQRFKQRGEEYTKEAYDILRKSYNNSLSQRRANSVTNYLIKKGISNSRLVAKGYGEENPIADNTKPDGSDNPEGRQRNRRTEIKVLENK